MLGVYPFGGWRTAHAPCMLIGLPATRLGHKVIGGIMFIAEGTIVDDKFEVVSSIGVGGMGVVYEAKQLGLDRLVALKLLSCAPSDAKEELVRFEREAFVLSKLQHINIVHFYAYGVWQSYPYIAMERISGVSLQTKLSKNEPIPIAQIIDYAMQICDGLEHAHSHSVFHRDIKPSNIIISTSAEGKDVVKLIDFGLAKLLGISVQKLTQTNAALGSVMYMSPEQCVGSKTIDARSDIYSIGCLLYHCFTGEPPYSADNAISVMFQQTNEPVDKCDRWTALPEAVQAIIARCMSKDPAQRYQNCSTVRGDLIRLSKTELIVSAPHAVARSNTSVATVAASPGRILRSYFAPAMAALAICLAMVYYFTTRHHTLANTEGKKVSTAAIETPKETLTRVAHHDQLSIPDPESANQLLEALRHCSQDTTIDRNVLLVGYGRLVNYYQRHDDKKNLRAAAHEGLENCRRATNLEVYGTLLAIYHRSLQEMACELSLASELKQILTKSKDMSPRTETELSILLAEDYLKLGRDNDAKPILDKIKPQTEDQRAQIAALRQRYKKTNGLVAEIRSQHQKHQGAADSVIKLSRIYALLGDSQRSFKILQLELQRVTENSKYDWLRLRLALASMYLNSGDYEKSEPILLTVLTSFEESLDKGDSPRIAIAKDYSETAGHLGFCYLRTARYKECATLGDRWSQHRVEIAGSPNYRHRIAVQQAHAYRHLGHFSDAEKIYKSILAHIDDNLPITPANRVKMMYAATANSGLACVYYRQAKYTAALKHAQLGVDSQAKWGQPRAFAPYIVILAECLQKLDRTTEASKELQSTNENELRSFAFLFNDIVPVDSVTSRKRPFQKINH